MRFGYNSTGSRPGRGSPTWSSLNPTATGLPRVATREGGEHSRRLTALKDGVSALGEHQLHPGVSPAWAIISTAKAMSCIEASASTATLATIRVSHDPSAEAAGPVDGGAAG